MRKRFQSTLPLATLVLASGGCGPTLVVNAKAGNGLRIGSLSFSPDEKQLAYAAADWAPAKGKKSKKSEDEEADEGSGKFHITSVPPSGKPRLVPMEGCTTANAYRLRWAHKKKRLAVAARDALYLLTPKGKKFTAANLVATRKDCEDTSRAGDILSLVWSPEDDQIAFSTGREMFTVPADGANPIKIDIPGLVIGETEWLTLLEWTEGGWVLKKGSQIISVDPTTRDTVVRHTIGDKDDWVAASPRGTIYVITSGGQVQEVRASGPKTILKVAPLLVSKSKKKGAAQHKYVIEVSPSGRMLAVAESLLEKSNNGSSVLSLVSLPGVKGKPKKAKKETEPEAEEGGEPAPPAEAPKPGKAEGEIPAPAKQAPPPTPAEPAPAAPKPEPQAPPAPPAAPAPPPPPPPPPAPPKKVDQAADKDDPK